MSENDHRGARPHYQIKNLIRNEDGWIAMTHLQGPHMPTTRDHNILFAGYEQRMKFVGDDQVWSSSKPNFMHILIIYISKYIESLDACVCLFFAGICAHESFDIFDEDSCYWKLGIENATATVDLFCKPSSRPMIDQQFRQSSSDPSEDWHRSQVQVAKQWTTGVQQHMCPLRTIIYRYLQQKSVGPCQCTIYVFFSPLSQLPLLWGRLSGWLATFQHQISHRSGNVALVQVICLVWRNMAQPTNQAPTTSWFYCQYGTPGRIANCREQVYMLIL